MSEKVVYNPTTGIVEEVGEGMTFRQYAAVAAMQGILAMFADPDVGGPKFADLASDSVRCADALIAELAKEDK